jgi:hypothetical protein
MYTLAHTHTHSDTRTHTHTNTLAGGAAASYSQDGTSWLCITGTFPPRPPARLAGGARGRDVRVLS